VCVAGCSAERKEEEEGQHSSTDASNMMIPLPDEQQIDYALRNAGAWQIGDIEKLHRIMPDDVSIVNALGAPIIGWNNYLAIYQQQRARMQQVRMDRSNTYIKVSGTVAVGVLPVGFCRHRRWTAKLIAGAYHGGLGKRNNRWLSCITTRRSRRPRRQRILLRSLRTRPVKPAAP